LLQCLLQARLRVPHAAGDELAVSPPNPA
jgi:hypothetical protein